MVVGAALLALPSRFADRRARASSGPGSWCSSCCSRPTLTSLLPDVITLPMIPVAFAVAALGVDPLVRGQLLRCIAAVGLPLLLFALSIPFGAGAIGMGDIKRLVSVGC